MRYILLLFTLLATSCLHAQNCSTPSFTLVSEQSVNKIACADDPNKTSIFVKVSITDNFAIKCTYTSGSSQYDPANPDNAYFSDTSTVTGSGICNPFNTFRCNPKMNMHTKAAITSDGFGADGNNQFFNDAIDQICCGADGNSCADSTAREDFHQCSGKACDAGAGGNGCDPTPQQDFMPNQDQPTNCDPVILDIGGNGFGLTNTANGVMFDIHANGRAVLIPWTQPGSDTAFLVLDRNGNGRIDDATELFSNASPQPAATGRNGFNALAQYDLPENGGNGDGVIDTHDAIFSKLRLWLDANHDGISQPEELHTLPEMGVFSISLNFQHTPNKTDQYGNIFLLRTKVNPGEKSDAGRRAYDVFFVTK